MAEVIKGNLVSSYAIRFKWIIEDYPNVSKLPNGTSIASPKCSTWFGDDFREWQLELFPNGEEPGCKPYVSLRINLLSGQPINISVQLSIIDRTNILRNVHHSQYHFKDVSSYVFPQFISARQLRRKKSLTGDSLNILCVIERVEMSQQRARDDSLNEHLNQLLHSKLYSDVTCLIDDKEHPLHRSILSSRSPVFRDLFKDKQSIQVNDMQQHVFAAMIRYIYTDQTGCLDKIGEPLLAAADTYQLVSLKKKCENFLVGNLSMENAVRYLALADLHSAGDLRSCAVHFIATNFHKFVSENVGWNMLVDSLKVEILLSTINPVLLKS